MSHFVPISGFFPSQVLGHLRPPGQIMQWDISKPNPSGFRHVESGALVRSAQIGNVGGFTAQKESGVAIDFGSKSVTTSGFQTDTVCLTFNMGQVNNNVFSRFDQMYNNGSGTANPNLVAFNFRFWVGELDAFSSVAKSGSMPISVLPNFYYRQSASWLRNYQLGIGDAGVVVLPSSMPSLPNVSSRGDDISASGSFQDREFTNYIYTRGFFPDLPTGQQYNLGTYGGLGEGTFRLKFSYDFTALDANILNPEDLTDI